MVWCSCIDILQVMVFINLSYTQGTNVCWSMMKHGRHSLNTTKRSSALLKGETSLSTFERSRTVICYT